MYVSPQVTRAISLILLILVAVYAALNEFAAKFIGEGPFFAGSEVTLADLTLLPWVRRFPIIEEHRGFSFASTVPKFQGKCDSTGLKYTGSTTFWLHSLGKACL
jgi:Glutathione S-transferase, C-terminal domain